MKEYYNPKYLVQDPDTPKYMEELSGGKNCPYEAFRVQQEDSTAVPDLVCIKCNGDAVES